MKPARFELLTPGTVDEAVELLAQHGPDAKVLAGGQSLVALMNLRHIVITCVDRDDLPDGGAAIWAETIDRVHQACPNTSVEALIGDFKGDADALQVVIDSRPEILAHNLETVKRMHPAVRPQADYQRSIRVLKQIKDNGLVSKSGIMVGLGEEMDEVKAVMRDQRSWGVDILTVGQYLQPSKKHMPISRYYTMEEFAELRDYGYSIGFKWVESNPLVRSSYHAAEQVRALSVVHRKLYGEQKVESGD